MEITQFIGKHIVYCEYKQNTPKTFRGKLVAVDKDLAFIEDKNGYIWCINVSDLLFFCELEVE